MGTCRTPSKGYEKDPRKKESWWKGGKGYPRGWGQNRGGQKLGGICGRDLVEVPIKSGGERKEKMINRGEVKNNARGRETGGGGIAGFKRKFCDKTNHQSGGTRSWRIHDRGKGGQREKGVGR